MEGDTLKDFFVRLGFDVDEKGYSNFKTSLAEAAKKFAVFTGVVKAASAAVYAGVSRIAEEEARLADIADRVGTSTDAIRELGFAAEQSGGSMEAVVSSLENIAKKNPGVADVADYLQQIGDRLQGMSRVQKLNYLSTMGIDPSLLQMLEGDVDGLRASFASLYQTVGIDSKKAAEEARAFTGEVNALKSMANLLSRSVALKFMAQMRTELVSLRKAFVENFGKIKAILESVVGAVLWLSRIVSGVFYRIIDIVARVVRWWDDLSQSSKELLTVVGLLVAAWKILNLAFLTSPLGIIITLLAALFLLVDDFLGYMEGKESLFDWGDWKDDILAVWESLKFLVGIIADLGSIIIGVIKDNALPYFNLLKQAVGWIKDSIVALGQVFVALFRGDVKGAAAAFGNFLKTLVLGWHNLFNSFKAFLLGLFTSLFKRIKERFPNLAKWLDGIQADFERAFARIWKAVSFFIDKIAGGFSKVKKGLKAVGSFFGLVDEEDEEETEEEESESDVKTGGEAKGKIPRERAGNGSRIEDREEASVTHRVPPKIDERGEKNPAKRFDYFDMRRKFDDMSRPALAPDAKTVAQNVSHEENTSNVDSRSYANKDVKAEIRQEINVNVNGGGDTQAIKSAVEKGAKQGANLGLRNFQSAAR